MSNTAPSRSLPDWRRFLTASRVRPPMYLGGPLGTNLIYNSLLAPSQVMLGTSLFPEVTSAALLLSPSQYCWTFHGQPIRPVAAAAVDLHSVGVLFFGIGEAAEAMGQLSAAWTRPFRGPHRLTFGWVSNLIFAERGIFAIRTAEGLWWQTYQDGWPTIAPRLETARGGSLCAMVGGVLTRQWFPELAFFPETAEAAIELKHRDRVKIVWH